MTSPSPSQSQQQSDLRTRERTPNKVQWNLAEIESACRQSEQQWSDLLAHLEAKHDIKGVALLARLRHTMAFIERKSRDAQDGRWQERGE